MEVYSINGVEVEYDTFDLTNMELFDSESKKIAEFIENELSSSSGFDKLREYAEMVRDFFDTVVGEGTSDKLFGDRDNIRDLRNGLMTFINKVVSATNEFKNEYDGLGSQNRDQRRAADRQKRREEAAKRAAIKAGEA